MANRTITIGFKIEDDGKGLKKLALDAGELKNALGGTIKSADGLKTSIINASMAAQGIAQLRDALGGVKNAIDNVTGDSKQFNDAMRATNTMAGLRGEEFDKLKQRVTELSKTVPVARDALAQGLYQVISNGVPEDNWISFLEASARSSVGGIADLGQAVGVTSTIIKNYGLEWSAAADIQDKIQLTAKNGVTSFEQLAQALPAVAGNAATLGVSIDDLMASFATLTGVSGNTSEVATQLASILTALVKPSSKATKMAEEMGIKFDAAAIKAAGGFSKFLTQLDADVKAFARANGMLEQEIYAKLFGRAESLRALIPLTGELKEKFTANIAAMADSAGTMDEAFEDMSKTSDAAAQRIKNSFADVGDTIAGVVAPVKPFLNMGIAVLSAAANMGVLVTSFGALKAAVAGSWLTKVITGLGLYTTSAGRARIATDGFSTAAKSAAISVGGVTTAIRGLMAATVIGAAVSAAVWGISKAIDYFTGSTKKATEATEEAETIEKRMADARQAAGARVADQMTKIEALVAVARDERQSLDDRKKAIDQLNRTIPNYNASLDSTSKKYRENKAALDSYLGSLQRQYELEGAKDMLKEIGRRKADARVRRQSALDSMKTGESLKGDNPLFNSAVDSTNSHYLNEAAKATKELNAAISESNAVIKAFGLGLAEEAEEVASAVETAGGGKKGEGDKSATKVEPVIPEESLKGLKKKIETIDAKIAVSTDVKEIDGLSGQRAELEKRVKIRENYTDNYSEIQRSLDKDLELTITPEIDMSKVKAGMKDLPKEFKKTTASLSSDTRGMGSAITESLQGAASTISSLSSILDDSTAKWGSFVASTISGIAQLLPEIAKLIGGEFAKAMAVGTAEGAAVGFPQNIAAIASIVATIAGVMASIPKFADGGIAYGPTLGLFGEYAGASRNPEVVAPLDRLQAILANSGGGNAQPIIVTGRIRGRDILLSASNTSRVNNRSGRVSNIK